MADDASLRQYRKIIGQMPELELERESHGAHIKFYLATPVGPRVFTLPRSASDWRAVQNNCALLRRWARGVDKA